MASSSVVTFDEDLFETRLEALKDSQESIQQMSSWCLTQRSHHKKIVTCWLNVLKRVRVEHRLILFYLANDVIQYSKRKRYEFVESWATALQRATTMVRDDKVRNKILRIFKIWEQREIYSEEYLSDLNGLLNIKTSNNKSNSQIDPDDFQNSILVAQIRECVNLSNATDKSFKKIPKTQLTDMESMKHQLKDKSHSEAVERDIDRCLTYTDVYNKNLDIELHSRRKLLANLRRAIKFYASQRGDVKVVVNAYKNFGNRIKLVKKKIDEMTPTLPSPIPSPDINAPSPEPDTDLQLPDDQSPISSTLFKNSFNGYSGYLDGNLPFDIEDFKRDENSTKSSSQPIEVIGSRSDDEKLNSPASYYKPISINAFSSNSDISIPGLNSIPIPVPPVQSEYSSLARNAQPYSGLLPPPPNPPPFGGYQPMMNSYSPDTGYHTNRDQGTPFDGTDGTSAGNSIQPLIPPPLPPLPGLGAVSPQSNTSAVFNSTWDMNMSWTGLDSSDVSTRSFGQNAMETSVSSPHFEREPLNQSATQIDYSEHDGSLLVGCSEDVDHRSLHLPPAFNPVVQPSLNIDKTRQVDIDHRNLISLTGSPGLGDSDKKPSWLSSHDQDHRGNDIDYRTLSTPDIKPDPPSIPIAVPLPVPVPVSTTNPMPPPPPQPKIASPQMSNPITTTESLKEELNMPDTSMVDMDMSDEDLDDIYREANQQLNEVPSHPLENETQQQQQQEVTNVSGSGDESQRLARPVLLETPPEYNPLNPWDQTSYPEQSDMQEQQQMEPWNQARLRMPWSGDGGNRASLLGVPPPPRPPFPMQFPYPNSGGGGPEHAGGVGPMRGRSQRGWAQNQFRNFSLRAPRPGLGGPVSPYFNNRGGGGGMRGNFRGMRGNFRGNHQPWV